VFDAFGRPQNAVVLGGTSDIAAALLDVLLADRCRTVILAGRDAEGLAAARERALGAGARCADLVTIDGTDPSSAGCVLDRCFDLVGAPIDLVIVAIGHLGSQERDIVDARRIGASVTANFTWPAAALGCSADRLRRQGCGKIVVLSSVAGVRVRPSNFLYGSAKRGLDGFALALAGSLRGSGVSLHVVRPGFVYTKMTSGLPPAPFAIGPEEVAASILRGLRLGRPIIWAPSTLRWASVALRLMPPALLRRL